MTPIADSAKYIALLLFLTVASAAHGNDYEQYEQAVRAYAEGQYKKAYELFLPLAERGDEDAQFHLGLMYDNGLGVKQDHAIAEQWYNRACPLPAPEARPAP